MVESAHARGLGNREIALELEIHHRTVASHLLTLGLETNNPRGKPPEWIDVEHSRCSHCRRPTKWEDFALVKSHDDGRRLTKCRSCRHQYQVDRLNDSIAVFLRDKVGRAKVRARKLGIDFDLTKEWALETYNSQKGLCFYTDIWMVAKAGNGLNPHALSFDRVDPSRGYVQANVVLTTNRANSIKLNVTLAELTDWLPGWADRVSKWQEGFR